MFRKTYLLIILFFLLLLSSPTLADTGYMAQMLAAGLTDNSANVLSLGKVYTYYAGTTTPVSLYTDVDMTTPADNPIILDSDGRAIVYGNGSYKFVVNNQFGLTVFTADNVELKSIIGFTTDASDPFGSTLYQTTLIASSVSSIDLTSTNITANSVSINTNLSSVGDTSLASATITKMVATLSDNLDANSFKIINLATPTEAMDALNLGYLEAKGISSSTIEVYKTVGVATWTCPSGVTKAYITICAGGGGGGGSGDNGNYAGEAGRCGQALIKYPYTVTEGNEYSITVGAGGSAGTDGGASAAGSVGSNGGDSYFQSLHVYGGMGGQPATAAKDCVEGLGMALSQPKTSALGNISYDNIIFNADCFGMGGMGGHIATYSSGVVREYPAGSGVQGVVIVEW